MLKKYSKSLIAVLFVIEVCFMYLSIQSYLNKDVEELAKVNEINNKTFAMFIENDSGEYDELLDSTLFPTDTHELNYELTTCVDNKGNSVDSSILAYSDGKVTATSNKTVFCYLYFEYLPKAYAIYSADDNSLRFYQNTNYETLGDTYNGLAVTEVYTDFLSGSSPWRDSSYKTTITNVIVEEEIEPTNTSNWFNGMTNVSYLDLTKLDTSKVTNMSYMFESVGSDIKILEFNMNGIEEWNVSSVVNMHGMFSNIGSKAKKWNIGNLNNWNIEKVTNISYMFINAGANAIEWNIGDLSNWNISNVTTIRAMFLNAGNKAEIFNLDLSTWDTSKVTNMAELFQNAAPIATNWSIGDISAWDTSNVQNMSNMFDRTGTNAVERWHLGNLNTKIVKKEDGTTYTAWDVSKVSNMKHMFYNAGSNAAEWDIGNLSTWNTSNVTSMFGMFGGAATKSKIFNLDLSKWNTAKVTDMSYMFISAGATATEWNIGNLSNWNVSNVNNLRAMFIYAATASAKFDIGNIGNWNTSNVTNMAEMFYLSGENASEWYVGDISKWNTSKVINMTNMFNSAGLNAEYSLDLSTKEIAKEDGTTYTAWDVSKVMGYIGFNAGVESKIIAPTWVTTTT